MRKEETNEYTDELKKIDLIGYLYEFMKALRKFFLPVLLIVVLCTATACLWNWKSYQPVYVAYTSFVITSSGESYNSNATAERLAKIFPYILTSGVLKDVVTEDIGYHFDSSIESSVLDGTNLFTITVRDSSPQTAYDVMNSVIKNYPVVIEYIIGEISLTIVDESGVPAMPANNENMERAAAIGTIAGLVISVLLLTIYLAGRKTIRSSEDMDRIASIKFLGNVPETHIKKRSSKKDQTMTIINAKVPDGFKRGIWRLRSRTEEELREKNCPIVLVTSAVPGEGKTTVAINLALAFAQKKQRVILIDGDFRNPSVLHRLDCSKKKNGILQVINDQEKLEDVLMEYQETGLKILPGISQASNPASVIRSKGMEKMIQKLKEQADIIVIDTPPSSVLADAAQFGGVADGAIMVIRQDFASVQQIQKGMETLADADIPIIGYLLNYMEEGPRGYGYSNYGYGRYRLGKYGYGRYEEEYVKLHEKDKVKMAGTVSEDGES